MAFSARHFPFGGPPRTSLTCRMLSRHRFSASGVPPVLVPHTVKDSPLSEPVVAGPRRPSAGRAYGWGTCTDSAPFAESVRVPRKRRRAEARNITRRIADSLRSGWGHDSSAVQRAISRDRGIRLASYGGGRGYGGRRAGRRRRVLLIKERAGRSKRPRAPNAESGEGATGLIFKGSPGPLGEGRFNRGGFSIGRARTPGFTPAAYDPWIAYPSECPDWRVQIGKAGEAFGYAPRPAPNIGAGGAVVAFGGDG